jgi:hypothetical protein
MRSIAVMLSPTGSQSGAIWLDDCTNRALPAVTPCSVMTTSAGTIVASRVVTSTQT